MSKIVKEEERFQSGRLVLMVGRVWVKKLSYLYQTSPHFYLQIKGILKRNSVYLTLHQSQFQLSTCLPAWCGDLPVVMRISSVINVNHSSKNW